MSDAIVNETVKVVLNPTLEDICLAYGSLFAMSILPIWIGSFRSVLYHRNSRRNGDQADVLSNRDALILPLIASYQLWSLSTLRNDLASVADDDYGLLNLLSKALLAFCCGLGVVEITRTTAPFLSRFWPRNAERYSLTVVHYKPQANADGNQAADPNPAGNADAQTNTDDGDAYEDEKRTVELIEHQRQKDEDNETDHDQSPQPVQIQKHNGKTYLALNFTYYDIIVFAASCAVCAWYSVEKHWVASNMIGLAIAVRMIESVQINTVKTGAILLGGFLVYDVFWVFGTDVMLSVAKSLDAPIKLVFPLNLLEKGLFDAKTFAMIGLGDIVMPGVFVALLLRFDMWLHEHEHEQESRSTNTLTGASARRTYFLAGCIAYIGGLVTTMAVVHWFNQGQPALLYLVPSCLVVPLAVALVRGDLGRLLSYADAPTQPAAASL